MLREDRGPSWLESGTKPLEEDERSRSLIRLRSESISSRMRRVDGPLAVEDAESGAYATLGLDQ